MVVSPEKADVRDDESAYSGTPNLDGVDKETAFLRSIVETRPVGPHKHVLMIQLQAELHSRTQVWFTASELWNRVEQMFDVDALDNRDSSSSLPDSPRALSPIPKRHTHHEQDGSVSPLSNPSRSSSPKPSKSAQLINSSYFGSPFTLPYFRLGQRQWKDNLPAKNEEADGSRRRSRSLASTNTKSDLDTGFRMAEAEVDMSPEDEEDWQKKIYEENDRATKGVDQEVEEELFTQGIEGQLAERDKKEKSVELKTKPPKKRPGRPSKPRKEREETSDLSDAGGDAPAEEEEEEPKAARAKRANAGKRKRDSSAKEESDEEKEVKGTKTRRQRK